MIPYLRFVEFRNFKNFRKVDFGPFHPRTFYVIDGQNGVGKSNFVDGLAFVLGERDLSKLRVSSVNRLLCRITSASLEDCSVTAVFCCEGDKLKRFLRTFDSEGCDVFKINNEVKKFDEYQKKLLELKVDVKLPNLIIPQGTIMTLATMTPEEMTKFFEETSGSSVFHEEYNRLDEKCLKLGNAVYFARKTKNLASRGLKQCIEEFGGRSKVHRLHKKADKAKKKWALFVVHHRTAFKEGVERKLDELAAESAVYESALDLKKSELIAKQKTSWNLSHTIYDLESKLLNEEKLTEHHVSVHQANLEYLEEELGIHKKSLHKLQANLAKAETAKKVAQQELLNFHTDNADSLSFLDSTACTCRTDRFQDEDYRRLRNDFESRARKLRKGESFLRWFLRPDSNSEKTVLLLKLQMSLDSIECLTSMKSRLLEKEKKLMKELQEREREEDAMEMAEAKLLSEIGSVEEQLDLITRELEYAKLMAQESGERRIRKANLVWLQKNFGEEAVICRLEGDRLDQLVKKSGENDFFEVEFVPAEFENCILVKSSDLVEKCVELIEMEGRAKETFIPITECMQKMKFKQREPPAGILMSDVIPLENGYMKEILRFLRKDTVVVESEEERRAASQAGFKVLSTHDDRPLMTIEAKEPGIPTADKAQIKELRICRKRLVQDLASLRKNLREEADKSMSAAKQASLAECIRKLVSKRDSILREMNEEQQSVNELEEQIRKVDEASDQSRRLNELQQQLKNDVFRDFCAKVGVANIDEYELCRACRVKGMKGALESMKNCLTEKLDTRDTAVEEIRAEVTIVENRIAEVQVEIAGARKQVDEKLVLEEERQLRILRIHEELLKTSAEQAEANMDISDLKEDEHVIEYKLFELRRRIVEWKCRLNEFEGAAKEASTYLRMKNQADGILQEGISPERASAEAHPGDPQGKSPEDRSLEMEDEGPQSFPITDNGAGFMDFSLLDENLNDAMKAYQIFKQAQKLNEERKRFEAERSCTENTPGEKEALLQMSPEEAQVALENATQDLDRKMKKFRRYQKRFKNVRKDRKRCFNECFVRVSKRMKELYKYVTDCPKAECSLIPFRDFEPYLAGILLSCWAPDRRHSMDVERFSSGEKTTLSFALVMSFDAYRRPPICVADEIESCTDASRRSNFHAILSAKSKDTQVFAISVREEIHDIADVIVTLCNDGSVLYLDLTEYLGI